MKYFSFLTLSLFLMITASGCSSKEPRHAFQTESFHCAAMPDPIVYQECLDESYHPYSKMP